MYSNALCEWCVSLGKKPIICFYRPAILTSCVNPQKRRRKLLCKSLFFLQPRQSHVMRKPQKNLRLECVPTSQASPLSRPNNHIIRFAKGQFPRANAS